MGGQHVELLFGSAILRGLGFGLLTVVSSALVMDLAPPHRRGAAIGQFGVITAASGIVGSVLGLKLLDRWEAQGVALGATACGAVALVLVAFVKSTRSRGVLNGGDASLRLLLDLLADRALRAYAVALVLTSVSWGGISSFLALALADPDAASIFFLVAGALRAIVRWGAGTVVDRGGHPVALSLHAVVLVSTGLLGLSARQETPVLVLAAMAYGVGTGALMTLLFLAMERRNDRSTTATTTLWAISFDTGGVIGTGVLTGVAAMAGYHAVLWTMPAITLLALPVLLGRRPDDRRVARG